MHPCIHACAMHSLIVNPFVYWFICNAWAHVQCIHSLIRSDASIRSFAMHSFICNAFVHMQCIRSFVHLFIRSSVTQSFICNAFVDLQLICPSAKASFHLQSFLHSFICNAFVRLQCIRSPASNPGSAVMGAPRRMACHRKPSRERVSE